MSGVMEFLFRPRRVTLSVASVLSAALLVLAYYWLGGYVWFRVAMTALGAVYWVALVHKNDAHRGTTEFFFAGMMVLLLFTFVAQAFGWIS